MKYKFTFSILASFLILSICVYANGLNLNSIGPKALGMGGAFIGIADDYTAVYWNPAGVVNLKKPQVALFVTDDIPASTYYYNINPLTIDAKSKTNHYLSPSVSGYLPLLNGDLTIGLGAFVPAGLGSEWDGNQLKALKGGNVFNWKSKIMAYSFSPAVAYKIDKMLSVGAAFNLYYATMDLSQPTPVGNYQYTETGNGTGTSVSLGLLYNPMDMLSIGLSFKSKNTVKLKGTATNTQLQAVNKPESPYSRDLAWPMWFGGGIALRPTDNLTIAADIQWSNWKKTEDTLVTTYDNWVPYMTLAQRTMYLHWKDCIQYRLGIQYMTSKTMSLRLGYYYDPAPAPDQTLNILFPSDTYNAVTIGCGNDFGWLNVDIGLEYLFGSKRTVTPGPDLIGGMPGDQQTNIFAFSLGFSYKFE
ncbi:MAG: outer membrane protein transport protein [FCB group bacterium]|jgi:long-chain fatty acid transport protein